MKEYNGEKYIVSFTTFPKRYELAGRMLFNLMKYQVYKDFHIVCTLYKRDYEQLSGGLKLMIDNDLLEVIVAEENLCPHLKYFYAMLKYHDKPIITVDDDRFYAGSLIQKLVSKYESLSYKSVVSTCAPVISRNILPISSWCRGDCRLLPNQMSPFAMAEGFGGVLYPSSCFTALEKRIPEIKECLFHDDIYLKLLEIDEGLPVTQIDGTVFDVMKSMNEISGAQDTNLAHHNNAPMDYRINVIAKNKTKLERMFVKYA